MRTTTVQHIEISRRHYTHNLETFHRLLTPGCRLMAVVKSNAYGHGLTLVAGLAQEAGVDCLGVNSLDEGITLRRSGITLPIVVLGYIPLEAMTEVIEYHLEPVLYNRSSLQRLDQEARRRECRAPFHLKLETGLHRQGVPAAEFDEFLGLINSLPALSLAGVSMHFANIEDTTNHRFARMQIDNFEHLLDRLRARDGKLPTVHAACSAAAILFKETHYDMARIGISSYGLWPSKETYLSAVLREQQPPVLKPILTWKSCVAQIRAIPTDSHVGYGCTYKATHPMRIAVIPVGYYDGYDRALSSRGHVLIRGRRAPVVGRVCMNMIMVDVTHIPEVSLEDEVVLLGTQGEETITAEELAELCHTINYEIVTRIGAHIPRRLGP